MSYVSGAVKEGSGVPSACGPRTATHGLASTSPDSTLYSIQPKTGPGGKYNTHGLSGSLDGPEYHDSIEDCTDCPVGTVSDELRLGCDSCESPLTTMAEGSASCDACRAGYFRDTSSSKCKPCALGAVCFDVLNAEPGVVS